MEYFDNSYRKNKLLITIEGMSANVLALGIQGFALTALALYFNCSPFWISIISSLPVGAQMLQLFLGKFYKFFKTRKQALMFSAIAARVPMTFLFFIILFDIKDYKVLVGIIFVYSFFSSFLTGIWTSSMGEVIKKEDRGSFFSMRYTLISISSIFFSYTVSKALNYTPGKSGMLILTGVVAIAAILTIILLYFQDIPDFDNTQPLFNLTIPVRDLNFINFLVFIGIWNFSIEFTKPYFYYFAVLDLKAPYSYLGLASSWTATISIFMFFIYGRIVKRIGYKKLLSFGISITTYVVIFYFLMTEKNVRSLLLLDAIGTAVGWSAINLSLLNLLLELSSTPRDSYTALYSIAVGSMGLLGAFVGGNVADLIGDSSYNFLGDPYSGFQLMFFMSIFLRFYCILLLTRVRAFQKSMYYPGLYPSLSYLFGSRR